MQWDEVAVEQGIKIRLVRFGPGCKCRSCLRAAPHVHDDPHVGGVRDGHVVAVENCLGCVACGKWVGASVRYGLLRPQRFFRWWVRAAPW